MGTNDYTGNNPNPKLPEKLSRSKLSLLKVLLLAFAVLISLLLLFAALLPTVISSKWGNDKLIAFANQQIPGTLSIEKVSLSWFGPQEFQDMLLKDPEGAPVLSLQKGSSQSSLFRLLWGDLSQGGLTLDDLNGTLSTDALGNTNLEKALNKRCCLPKTADAAKPLTIMFKDVNAVINLDTTHNKPLTVHLTGETMQNTQSGKFAIDAQLKGVDIQQLVAMDQQMFEHLRATGVAEFKVNAEIVNLPVALLDQFIALKNPKFAGLLQEMLGQQLDLTINQLARSQGLEFALNAKSDQLTASAEVSVNTYISLTKPLSINFKITPQLADKIAAAFNMPLPWKLKSPTTGFLLVDAFKYPVALLENQKFSELDLTPLALNAKLEMKPTSISNRQDMTIDILQLIAKLQTGADSQTATVVVNGNASQNGQPFAINLNATVTKPQKLGTWTKDLQRKVIGQAEIKGLPIAAIDSQLGLNQQLLMAVGSSADISLSIQNEKNKPSATLRWKSEFVDIPNLSFNIDEGLNLSKQGVAKIYFSPSLIEKLAAAGNPDGPRLRDSASAVIKINNFSVPWQSSQNVAAFLPDEIALDADIAFSALSIMKLPAMGDVALNDLNLHIQGESLSQAALILKGTLSQIGSQGFLRDVLGEQTKFVASANLRLMLTQPAAIDSLDLKVVSDLAQINLTAAIHENNMLTLTAPAVFSYTITSAALKSLGISATDNFLVRHGTPLEFSIAKSKIPFNLNDISALTLGGDLKIKDLTLSSRSDLAIPQAILEKLDMHWVIDMAARAITLNFDGATRLGQQQNQGSFYGSAVIDSLVGKGKTIDFDQAILRLKANAYKLPAAFVGAFIKQTDLTPLIGDSFEAHISAEIGNVSKPKGAIEFDVKSELMVGSANLLFNDGVFLKDSAKPAQIEITLTPQGYAALRQQLSEDTSDFALSESARMILQLKALNMPWKQNAAGKLSYWNSGIDLDMFIDKLAGTDNKTQRNVKLSNIRGSIHSDDISQHTAFNFHAEGPAKDKSAAPINILGSLEKGFTSAGTINRKDLSLNLEATLTQLPVSLLCQFVCADPKLSQKLDAIIGPHLDATIKAQLSQMNGPIYLDLKGANGHTILDGQLTEGTLTLNNNFYAELTVTPQLGKYVLQDIIPFLSGILGADQPLKFAIAKEGFSLPLRQFDIESISIGSATLELGRVRFSNDGQLAKVLSLLTTASASEIMVWLTPTYFSLTNGLFALQRVDMLIGDRYPIAAWGKVNIPGDNVNMAIGLSGAAIGRAFNVPGIKKSFMLQLPLRGTMRNASIDKSKAVARLSALVAQSQGGPQGLVLGTVIDIATGSMAEETPPAPTTNPLPWDAGTDESNDQQGTSNKPIKEVEKIIPIEEIGKGAGNLLKKLFR